MKINYGVIEELVKKSVKGDEKALRRLLLIYEKKIEFSLFKLVKNSDYVKDIKQEIFIKISKNIKKLKNPQVFDAWLHKIILNSWLDYKRHERLSNIAIKDFKNIIKTIDEKKPQDIVLNSEKVNKIQGAVERLKREEKAILYLRNNAKLSYDEMADILGIKKGTIKSRLYRIRKKLEKMLGEYIKSS